MRRAFKEWAVICRALASGRQTVILRKGGIIEEGGTFRPDYAEFLLFPTYSHQSPESVLPDARRTVEELEAEQPETGEVVFRHYAVVTDALRVESFDAVRALRAEHVWSDEVIEERFHRWREDAIYAIVVRVYRLPTPMTLELREEYTGCKSWVYLDEEVPTEAATPVLTEGEFTRRASAIRAALGVVTAGGGTLKLAEWGN